MKYKGFKPATPKVRHARVQNSYKTNVSWNKKARTIFPKFEKGRK